MTRLEERLRTAMHGGFDAVQPSPDLFARVQGSIADAAERRAFRLRIVQWLLAAAGVFAALALSLVDYEGRKPVMDWWVLELLTTSALVGIALLLGPFIKRFGKSFAADVFRANPGTGKSFIVLTDIAYYLIFLAYILFTVKIEPDKGWESVVNAAQVKGEIVRVGGILLIIGILHSVNLLALPVMGRLLTLNRRLDDDTLDREADQPRAPRKGGGSGSATLPAGTGWVLRIEPSGPGTGVEQ